jgi:lipoyl-dependent peroxiredoxin
VERHASAVWNGTLKEGNGTMSTESGVLKDVGYTWAQRFADAPGTNPEELLGAAHAGCYSMALAGRLTTAGFPPERIATTANVTLEKTDAGQTVTRIHLVSRAKVPGIQPAAFAAEAETTRTTCPISRLLKADITVDAALE